MEQLKQSTEILKLGKQLVKELNLNRSADTLSKWMAHYIAELIHKAEHAETAEEKAALEKECCEVILRLWNNRDIENPIQNLYPLSGLEDVINILKQFKNSDSRFGALYSSVNVTGRWASFIQEVIGTSKELINIAIVSALSEAKLDQNINWTEEYMLLLTEEEKKIIKELDDLLMTELMNFNSAFRFTDGSSITDLSPEERENKLFGRLEELVKKQIEKVENLKK